jgi:predicted MFS family arabinose efflux permease
MDASTRPITPAAASTHAGWSDPSARSVLGLDAVAFLMADVSSGIGPFLAVFLKAGRHWGAGDIGMAMAVSAIAAAVCQIPAGLLVDGSHRKRTLLAVAALAIGAACLLIALVPALAAVVVAQTALGAAGAVVPPALAALSLGLVGRRALPARVSRNEMFNHGGNFLGAGLAGAFGQYVGYDWIFYVVSGFAVVTAGAVFLIRRREVDDYCARGGEDGGETPLRFRDLLRRQDLRTFLIAVCLFHFGNAAMLPLAGQMLAHRHPGTDAIALMACMLAAQLVMLGVAWAVGRASAAGWGRKPIFLIAFAVLPLRGVLFCLVDFPLGVVAIQLLDGVAAGIFGVVSVMVAADLMRGTGRFNLAQGLVALAVGLGGGLSNLSAGYVVQAFGYQAGFGMLAGIALAALVFFAAFMPETRPADEMTA